MAEPSFSDAELEHAIEALSDRERFREAERRLARVAPQLQRILAAALAEGGWFESGHEDQLKRSASLSDVEERVGALRTLLAEEARVGMLVGVAVGWELARELERGTDHGPDPSR